MANVNIKFNGKEFLLSCEDGQEEHLEELALYLNEKFSNLKNSFPLNLIFTFAIYQFLPSKYLFLGLIHQFFERIGLLFFFLQSPFF